MKIKEIKHIRDCIDKTVIKEFLLSEKIDRDFIYYLAGNDEFEYKDNLRDAFFGQVLFFL